MSTPVTAPAGERDVRDHDWIMAQADAIKARGATAPRPARHPVNEPTISAWLDAMGDENPRYRGDDAVVPTAMTQVWTMYGLVADRPAHDPLHNMMEVMNEAGFTSVLGTNCDQTYARYLRVGEHPVVRSELESVVGPKRTGMGEGYFVTSKSTWFVDDEPVATMLFRVLKFKPRPKVAGKPVQPVVNRDSEFFWEGTEVGEVRIQRCNACGALRHPPGPVCPDCHAMDRGYVVAAGTGTVFSYLVHHAPQVPGKQLPLRLGLVELDEGVRMVGELGEGLAIGDRVHARFAKSGDVTLVRWDAKPAELSQVSRESVTEADPQVATLETTRLEVTPTLITAGAIATRDFQDVHHDRDLAVAAGSKDIFMNILTTTGLVQRYVTEQLGHDTVIHACELRLGAPAYPGDTLEFSGAVSQAGDHEVVVVIGRVSLGDHVTAKVTVSR